MTTDADALFEQAADRLRGEVVPRDIDRARDLFRRAGALGRRDASVIFTNLLAAGVGGARDWPGALARLADLAETDRRCRAQLDLLGRMRLTEAGDPIEVPTGERISERPDIRRFRALLTPAECLYLARAAAPMLQPAVVIDAASGRQMPDPVRTSDSTGFTWPLENPAVHALNRRIAAASGTEVEAGEPLQVLRYRPGEQYRTHFDAIAGFDNPRRLTMIVWLNASFRGGETHFPAAGLSLRGAPGDAILFRNTDDEGRRDPASAHAGLPVAEGEKWIASRWIRARRFEPPTGAKAA